MKNEDTDNLTKEEKAKMLLAAEYKRERMEDVGKIIVIVIAVANILMSIFSFAFGTIGIFALIVDVVFSIALISGRNWARILFIIGLVLSVVALSFTLAEIGFHIMLVFALVYSVVAMALLFSKSVSEYMYRAKNG